MTRSINILTEVVDSLRHIDRLYISNQNRFDLNINISNCLLFTKKLHAIDLWFSLCCGMNNEYITSSFTNIFVYLFFDIAERAQIVFGQSLMVHTIVLLTAYLIVLVPPWGISHP